MQAWAFAISLVALVVSLGSGVFTGIQAAEARTVRKIEAARRRDELTPQLVGDVEDMGGWHRLGLALQTSTPLTRLEVQILGDEAVFFTTGTQGVAPMTAQPREAVYDLEHPLAQGQRYTWALEYDPLTGPDELQVRATCYAPDHNGRDISWQVLIQIDMPIDFSRTVF
jgi:hypothetical protein